MAIKYVSAHDSPDDPGGLIRQVLDMGPEFPGPARDILLAWILRLGNERDPAEAAGRLLAAYGIAEEPVAENAAGPGFGLEYVVHHIAVTEHRAFGQACRSAGVLQECDVRKTQFDVIQR